MGVEVGGRIVIRTLFLSSVQFYLLASNPAPFVYLDNTNYDGVFSDNGFMMDQMAPVRVTFKTYTSPISTPTFQAGLMIRYEGNAQVPRAL